MDRQRTALLQMQGWSLLVPSNLGLWRSRYPFRILNGWSIGDRLHEVNVPVLVINGRYDIAQDYVIAAYHENIAGAKWVKFENSSHLPCWEERAEYMTTVAEFLDN